MASSLREDTSGPVSNTNRRDELALAGNSMHHVIVSLLCGDIVPLSFPLGITVASDLRHALQMMRPLKPCSSYQLVGGSHLLHDEEPVSGNEYTAVIKERLGVIVMDSNSALFGSVVGQRSEVLHRFSVELPRGRPRNSSLPWARLRLENIHTYVTKVNEKAAEVFKTLDGQLDITRLIVACPVFLEGHIAYGLESLDVALKNICVKPLIIVTKGGEQGFQEVLENLQNA